MPEEFDIDQFDMASVFRDTRTDERWILWRKEGERYYFIKLMEDKTKPTHDIEDLNMRGYTINKLLKDGTWRYLRANKTAIHLLIEAASDDEEEIE